ncbi:MAG: hypothetical protein L0I24_06990, partial [Pseudonocardia sp.]|nr:hypothetical protein [Pseudonocardia sp.]
MSTNDARRGHWRSQWSAKIEVEQAVAVLVRAARVPKLDRCALDLTWYVRDYRVRDDDGLSVLLKSVRDALTPPRPAVPAGTPTQAGTPRKKAQRAKIGAGIIPDDSARYVASSTTAIVMGSDDPRIELTIHARD